MAFRIKVIILVGLLIGGVVIFRLFMWINPPEQYAMPPHQTDSQHVRHNSPKQDGQTLDNAAISSAHTAPSVTIPDSADFTLREQDQTKIILRSDKSYELPLYPNLSSASTFTAPSIVLLRPTGLSPAFGEVVSLDLPKPVGTVISDQWTEPELMRITAIVGFPQTKTYKLGEAFMVTLAVNKGIDSSTSLSAVQSLGIMGITTKTAHPLMTSSGLMKATLSYAGKKVDTEEPEIKPVSFKEATIWSWQVTPDSPGRHYMKIILSAQLPNNQPDFSKPFIYELIVTEDMWSHINRIMSTWITPEWLSAELLLKTILIPFALFLMWKIKARWRAYRRNKKAVRSE